MQEAPELLELFFSIMKVSAGFMIAGLVLIPIGLIAMAIEKIYSRYH